MAASEKRCARFARRAGTTLVELIVSMLLIEILAAMAIGVLGPASAAFAKLQKTITAQSVIDNISEEIAKNLQDITGNVRIYKTPDGDAAADPQTAAYAGAGEAGSLLEYQNPDGYIVLLSADGCDATNIYIGTAAEKSSTADPVNAGRLLLRYYAKNTSETSDYTYTYLESSGALRARSVATVFTDKYYMDSYLAVSFAYPDTQVSGESVQYLTVTVSLYKDEARTDLVTSETTTVQLRYDAKCYFDTSAAAARTAVKASGS